MARMGRSTVQKRLSAPQIYEVPRKPRHGRFVVRTGPGPHPREASVDPVMLLRDLLGLVRTADEALYALKHGYVRIDGVVRNSEKFPVGLMDVVEVVPERQAFRVVPSAGSSISLVKVSDSEKDLKLVRVTSKVTVRGGRTQLGTHDGRSLLVDDPHAYNVGDSVLVEVPSQAIVERVPLEPGVTALVVGGSRTSSLGRIERVIPGSFSTRPSVELDIDDERVLILKDLVMPVGAPSPKITVRMRG